jgi:hypothetical protein
MLRKLIPATASVFKSSKRQTYTILGIGLMTACINGSPPRVTEAKKPKRVFVSEVHTALKHLRTTGALDRRSFQTLCPKSERDSGCGFAVAGRILEELSVARYSGRRAGFMLTDPERAHHSSR